ncbi:T9SS type A sorting domain-containing protein [Bacteroidota bacterium]
MEKFYSSKLSVLISITMLVLFFTNGFAQGLINDGAKVRVSTGTYVTVSNGGFTNQTNGASIGQVTNAGTITLDGSWSNSATSNVFGTAPTATTGGSVVLNGASGTQSIKGSVKTNFWNLNTSGTKKQLLNVDATVFNTLTLGADLDLNTRTLTLENGSVNAIQGTKGLISETDPSEGMGVLSWKIGNTPAANSTFVVPFATRGGVSIPFTYKVVNNGNPTLGTPNVYKKFSTYNTVADNTDTGNSDWPTGVTHLTNNDPIPNGDKVVDRFWYIDNDVQGNYAYNTIPRMDYTFTFDPTGDNQAGNTFNPANLVAQRFNVNDGKWLDWLYSATAVGNAVTVQLGLDQSNVTSSVIDYYPAWTLVDNSDPLPIELARFISECLGGSTKITWTTWTESNNDHFTVERSKNGIEFEVVDVVNGAGNSNEPINYSIIDDMPYGGTSYYRIKTTDYDGTDEYSEIIASTCGADKNDFSFINAYDIDNTDLMLEFTAADNENYTVVLYDASGRIILNRGGNALNGMNKVRLSVGDLARGIYIVNLSNGQRVFNKRVMLH